MAPGSATSTKHPQHEVYPCLLRGGGDAAKSGVVGRPCKNWQRCYATGEEMDPLNLQENRAARWGHFTPADLS